MDEERAPASVDDVRRIMEDFVGRCYDDVMIGYLFRRAPKARIVAHETELMAEWLGLGLSYAGRPLGEAHRAHRLFDGHFDRRRTLLRETLLHHRVPQALVESILVHQDSLRAEVLGREGAVPCNAEESR